MDRLERDRVNRTDVHSLDISGKGINVTRVLTQLGEDAVHLTHAGGGLASFFLRQAKKEGVPVRAVRTTAPIRICITILEKSAATTTEIVTDGAAVGPGTEQRVRRAFRALLRRCRAVIISGSKALGYSDDLYPDLVRETRAAGKPVICDYRGRDLKHSIPHRPDVIKPNFTEFVETFFPDRDARSRDDGIMAAVEAEVLRLSRENGITTVLTDGGRPALYSDGTRVSRLAPPLVHPVNTTGCGDAFTAGFARAWLAARDLPAAMAAGMDAAVRSALRLQPGVIV